jgi:hypothetical protein
MGGECIMHQKDEKCIRNLTENVKERVHTKNLGIDGKIILEWILRK